MDPIDIRDKAGKAKTGKQKIALKSPLFAIFIACIIAVIYVYSFIHIPAIEKTSLQSEDYAFRLRHWYYSRFARNYLRPKDIVLVTIDEESYKKLEKRWPWSRDVFAEFLDKLSAYNPRTIALDFVLYGQTPDKPEADAKLAESIKRCGNVIIASVYGKDQFYLGPHDMFAEASAAHGVIGAVRDKDNTIRRLKTFALAFLPETGGDVSFEVKIAARYLDVPYKKIHREGESITLESKDKRLKIPTSENSYILVNYLSDVEDVNTVSIWRVMQGGLPQDIFKDKLVLVSQTGEIFHDFHPTPLGYRAGGLIIANVLNSIISSSYLKEANPEVAISLIAIIYILAFLAFYRISPLKGFFLLLFIMAAYLAASFFSFLNGKMWPVFHVVILLPCLYLGMAFYKYGNVVFERAEMKRMAITDSLTELYTHRYFRFLLDHTANKALNSGNKCSLIVIKILNLDRIIKEIGFNKGQGVQRGIAELVKIKLPKRASGTYLGMGEFGMLLPKVGLYEALGIAGSLRNRIKETDFDIPEDILKPTVAMGVSAMNPKGFPKTGVELMRSTRTAMARAKVIGYNKICRFNPNIDSSVFEPDAMEREIRQRLDDEFSFLVIDLEERNKELEDLLRQLSITQKELEQAHFETLRSLIVALEQKDPCTAGHSERVGDYTEKIGMRLKMPEEEVRLLKQAAVLHDIGKVGISQDILRKEAGLSRAERHIIELHPEFSVRILNTSRYFNRMLHAIRDHHERLDGSGYPRGLKGENISPEAQIISVCDTFDAMNSDRPYRKALPPAKAMDEILAHPEHFNRTIALALKRVLKEEGKLKEETASAHNPPHK